MASDEFSASRERVREQIDRLLPEPDARTRFILGEPLLHRELINAYDYTAIIGILLDRASGVAQITRREINEWLQEGRRAEIIADPAADDGNPGILLRVVQL